MLNWFRNRIRNSREWFRIDSGANSLEGTKLANGSLEVSLTVLGTKQVVTFDRDSVKKLSMWMGRCYPAGEQNVIRSNKFLSLRSAPSDSERGPPGTSG